MDNKDFNNVLLLTAFSFMACDGDIAQEEVQLIKDYNANEKIFGEINIDEKLDFLVQAINEKGKSFLKEYQQIVSKAELTKKQEIDLLKVAMKMILADNVIEYSEVKFFKVIRKKLQLVTDEEILEQIEGIEEYFLEEDINADYMKIYDSYFENIEIPKFDSEVIK